MFGKKVNFTYLLNKVKKITSHKQVKRTHFGITCLVPVNLVISQKTLVTRGI
jgi:hypothetical protein